MAGVALLAVALFAFMAMNTGGDGSGASGAADADGPDLEAVEGFDQIEVPTLDGADAGGAEADPGASATVPEATVPAAAGSEPRNVGEYCTGVRQVSVFLYELGQAARVDSTATYADLRASVSEHRASVEDGLALIVANGPPDHDADAATMRDGLAEMLRSVSESATEEQLEARYSEEQDTALVDAMDRMLPTWEARCA